MVKVIVQVRDLVSSNVGTMVEKATDPAKMLRSLRREIQEADIALHGELTKLRRQHERAGADAVSLDQQAKDWTDKAKIAMDNGREDLARSALLAREAVKEDAETKRSDAKAIAEEISDSEAALAKLQDKLAETGDRLRECENLTGSASKAAKTVGAADSASDRRMDRISNLERRVDFALNDEDGSAKTHATVDAEIAEMQRDASVTAELDKLRKGATAKSKKAAKG